MKNDAALITDLKRALSDLFDAREEIARVTEDAVSFSTQCTELREQLAAARAELAKAQHEHECQMTSMSEGVYALTKERDAARSAAGKTNELNMELYGQIDALKTEITRLREALTVPVADVEAFIPLAEAVEWLPRPEPEAKP